MRNACEFGVLGSLPAPGKGRAVQHILWLLFSLWWDTQHLNFQGTSDLRILAQPAERSLGMHKPGMVVYTCLSQSSQAVKAGGSEV